MNKIEVKINTSKVILKEDNIPFRRFNIEVDLCVEVEQNISSIVKSEDDLAKEIGEAVSRAFLNLQKN